MMRPVILTIGRQFGSGGHEIGSAVAKALDLPFYDRDLLRKAAAASGLSEDILAAYDEQPTNSFLYSLSMGATGGSWQLPLGNQAFLAMTEAIRHAADGGSCVIVGRCAEYVLQDRPDLLRVFIYADLPSRTARIMEKRDLSEKQAAALIQKTDRQRAGYHNFYADDKWGVPSSYDVLLNSHALGIDGCV
ncbi:MAG: cytidylate kinase-like family protein, partial [Clostridia bacterium]|nr:cytidylate kinase-like family protein [Clostridia bacterium]